MRGALKAAILPHDNANFDKILDVLEKSGRIGRYTVDGREFCWIRSWNRHQVINNKERDSILPPPPDEAIAEHDSRTREERDLHATSTREERVTQGKEQKARGERDGNGNWNGNGTGTEVEETENGKGTIPCEQSCEQKASFAGTETATPPSPPRGGGNLASTKRVAERILTSLNEPCSVEVIEAACSEVIAMCPNETENRICEHLVSTRRLYEDFATDQHKRPVSAEIFFSAGLWKDSTHWAKFLKPYEDMQ